ncbi:MAG: hypothetical protein LBQ90_12220, partial [Synergistaceae bacterium]|nr:hypothetical protein [Synergistaceae bacterium]
MRGSPEDPLDRDGDGAGEKTSAAFRVERFEVGMEEGRVDTFLSRQLGVTRAFVQKLIKEGRVQGVLPARSPFSSPRMKSPKIKPSRGIARGEAFIVKIPPPESLEIEPEDVPFEVVYEDRWLLVVNKPAGLVVHPAPGHWR